MPLAASLRDVLNDASAALGEQGTEDTAVMTAQAARHLGDLVAGAPEETAEDAAVRLVDHLFRGSAAAGAIQSMPPVPVAKAGQETVAPAERAPRVPASTAGNPSKETT